MSDGRRQWWWFNDRFYWEDDGLTHSDVMALALQQDEVRQRRLQNARSRMAQGVESDNSTRRQQLSREAKLRIWEKDGGRCRNCGSDRLLQFDHVIPLAMGGSNSEQNFQLLCDVCNQRKGSGLLEPDQTPLPAKDPSEQAVVEEVIRLDADFYEAIVAERRRLTEALDSAADDSSTYCELIVITNLMTIEKDQVERWVNQALGEADKSKTMTPERHQAFCALLAWSEESLDELENEFAALAKARDALAESLDDSTRAAAVEASSERFAETKARISRPIQARLDDLTQQVAT